MSTKAESAPTLAEILAYYEAKYPAVAPLPENHPAYALIGRVAVAWADLEHRLDTIIWLLAGEQQERLACITGQMIGAYPRTKAIIALLRVRTTETKKAKRAATLASKFSELSNKLGNTGEKRNRYVHDAWYIKLNTEETAQFRSMPFKEPHLGIKEVSADEIAETISEIAKHIQRIEELKILVENALEAWHERRPGPPPAWTGRTGPLLETRTIGRAPPEPSQK